MQNFCVVFNCSNHADREKSKANYCFPSIVKNNVKEGFTLSFDSEKVTVLLLPPS